MQEINKGKEYCDFMLDVFNSRLNYKKKSDLLKFHVVEGHTEDICILHFNLYNEETGESKLLINIQHKMNLAKEKSQDEVINMLWIKLAESILKFSIWSLSNEEYNLKSFRSFFEETKA